jgi:hypothetical protein
LGVENAELKSAGASEKTRDPRETLAIDVGHAFFRLPRGPSRLRRADLTPRAGSEVLGMPRPPRSRAALHGAPNGPNAEASS